MDGDGRGDLIIGAPGWGATRGAVPSGRAYVLFGRRGPGTIDLARARGRAAVWTLQPPPVPSLVGAASPGFGLAVAGPGDMDGDGRPDVAVGAPYAGVRNGAVYVVYARPARGGRLDLATTTAGWYALSGAPTSDLAGWALAPAGDQNGDGLADLLVGELAGGPSTASSYGVGAATVVYGSRDHAARTLDELGAGGGYVVRSPVTGDRLGFSVASAPDLDGDGRPELLVGAPLLTAASRAQGGAWVLRGGARTGILAPGPIALASFEGTGHVDTAGWSVAGLGDFNGDRRPDVAVSAPRVDRGHRANVGAVYVVYGTASAAPAARARATAGPAPARIRIAGHPAFVRLVVDVRGRLPAPGAIMAADPDPYRDGRVRVVVPGRGPAARAVRANAAGVSARVTPGRSRLVLSVAAAQRRFKYAGYRVLHAPERLVVDLYRSAPPATGARARYGAPGCLTLTSVAAAGGRVAVAGTEHEVFEHSFPVVVRSAAGRVLGRRAVAAVSGRWSARVGYRVARAQTGTLEAVELSAKDGALSCLAQLPVRLRP